MKHKGIGTKIKIGANAMAQLNSINGFDVSADTVDETTYDSNGWREFGQGLKDAGEMTFGGFFEPGDTNGQKAVWDALDAGTLLTWVILFPADMGADFTVNGIVTKFSVSPDMEGDITFEATVKISGKPTLGLVASGGLTNLALAGTGGTLSPTFANGTYFYSFGGVTAGSITVTATAASHTLQLYVDNEYVQDLTSGSASAAIAMSIGSRLLTILAKEAAKTTKVYEIVAIKTA